MQLEEMFEGMSCSSKKKKKMGEDASGVHELGYVKFEWADHLVRGILYDESANKILDVKEINPGDQDLELVVNYLFNQWYDHYGFANIQLINDQHKPIETGELSDAEVAALELRNSQAAMGEALNLPNIKLGDQVHLGFGAKGGAGFYGEVVGIDGRNITIKHENGKIYQGPIDYVTPNENLEELDMPGAIAMATADAAQERERNKKIYGRKKPNKKGLSQSPRAIRYAVKRDEVGMEDVREEKGGWSTLKSNAAQVGSVQIDLVMGPSESRANHVEVVAELWNEGGQYITEFPVYVGPKQKMDVNRIIDISKRRAVKQLKKKGYKGAGLEEAVEPGQPRHFAKLVKAYNDAVYREHQLHMDARGGKRYQTALNKLRAIEKEIYKHYGKLSDAQGNLLKDVGIDAYDTDHVSSFVNAFMGSSMQEGWGAAGQQRDMERAKAEREKYAKEFEGDPEKAAIYKVWSRLGWRGSHAAEKARAGEKHKLHDEMIGKMQESQETRDAAFADMDDDGGEGPPPKGKYPDTKEGAIAFLQDETEPGVVDLSKAKAIPDPYHKGVWQIKNAIAYGQSETAIVYLPYLSDMGGEWGDFEMSETFDEARGAEGMARKFVPGYGKRKAKKRADDYGFSGNLDAEYADYHGDEDAARDARIAFKAQKKYKKIAGEARGSRAVPTAQDMDRERRDRAASDWADKAMRTNPSGKMNRGKKRKTKEAIIKVDDPDYEYMDDETGQMYKDQDDVDWWNSDHPHAHGNKKTKDGETRYKTLSPDAFKAGAKIREPGVKGDKWAIIGDFGDIAGGGSADPIDYVMQKHGVDMDQINAIAQEQGYDDAYDWAASYQGMGEARNDSIKRRVNKAMSWGDISSPGGPKGMMKRIRSYSDQELIDLVDQGGGDGSARGAFNKLAARELKRRFGVTPGGDMREAPDNTPNELQMEMATKAGFQFDGVVFVNSATNEDVSEKFALHAINETTGEHAMIFNTGQVVRGATLDEFLENGWMAQGESKLEERVNLKTLAMKIDEGTRPSAIPGIKEAAKAAGVSVQALVNEACRKYLGASTYKEYFVNLRLTEELNRFETMLTEAPASFQIDDPHAQDDEDQGLAYNDDPELSKWRGAAGINRGGSVSGNRQKAANTKEIKAINDAWRQLLALRKRHGMSPAMKERMQKLFMLAQKKGVELPGYDDAPSSTALGHM